MLVAAVVLLASFFLSCSFVDAQKKTAPPPDYFPLQVGYWWTYKSVEKGWEFTLKVTGIENIGALKCYKVETIAANNQVMFIDYYHKSAGKVLMVKQVYPTSKNEVTYQPVREYLHNPLKVGDTWSWKGKGIMDVEIEDTSKVAKIENIAVPAGKFSAAEVDTKNIQGGMETTKKYWYAPNIGMVKSYTESSNMKNTAQLIKYNLSAKK
jgi:hypothetical protein